MALDGTSCTMLDRYESTLKSLDKPWCNPPTQNLIKIHSEGVRGCSFPSVAAPATLIAQVQSVNAVSYQWWLSTVKEVASVWFCLSGLLRIEC
jgi:hypothetical protein